MKKICATIMLIALCLNPAVASAAYDAGHAEKQITNHSNTETTRKWAQNGISSTFVSNSLRLNDNLLREEAAHLLSSIIHYETQPESNRALKFIDVDPHSPYYECVTAVTSTGVMNGITENIFGMGQHLTREQAAVILYRVFSTQLEKDSRAELGDILGSSEWARGSISVLAGNGIVFGNTDGNYMPHNPVTRKDFITLLYRLMPQPHKITVNVPTLAEMPEYVSLAHLHGKKLIALTYDDGPNRINTALILDSLKKYDAKATFFMIGSKVPSQAEIAKRVVDEGHQIANHTFSHKALPSLSPADIQTDINHASNAIERATGVRPTLLRPPYGSHNAKVRDTVDMPIMLWSIDPRDWSSQNADAIFRNVTSQARDGDIILLHDNIGATARATPRIIEKLQQDGFIFVTLDELIAVRGGAEAGKVYYRFR